MTQEPSTTIAALARAHIAARCLHVVADFGVADALDDGVATAAELARSTGLSADALERMLRLLAAHGVFEQRPAGYAHNAASRHLRSDHPQSLRAYVRMNGQPGSWNSFTDLRHAAVTGRPAQGWARLLERHAEHPDEAAVFNAAMTAKSRNVVPAVVAAYDWHTFGTIADIGGGRGHLLQGILDAAPNAVGILFDLPRVAAEAAAIAAPRLRIVAGDFLAGELPAADAYVLMDLLHDWSDPDAARILAAVRRAAQAHARLLIVETLVAEAPGPHAGKTLDVIMLAVTGGRERTPSEYDALLGAAGFRLQRVIPTRSEYALVEAIVA
jgi:hypothetical protein